ncbi:protein-glutamine gamma-glutamyltransferase K-like isoform X1 [Poeciliopsis prolifica]|uniref:protein-glutamine gamma-glutamyltransferase K-like isoform X1 n=1 Tax=Poeciliopsis prolifica TaxID=188132 RepID=UPI0024133082|nr:protein-glutamine gamma-glutamyltransferase K-like isoform X1 [Poeciliopsis prolifica]
MPPVIHSVRDSSAVGRFPSVTLPFVEDVEVEKEEPAENGVKKESACRRWLRKACPCCYKRPGDDDDAAETVVTGVDDPDKEEEGNGEKPTTEEGNLNELLLNVRLIDLMKSKTGANLVEHHTNLYQSDKFVIRRGQTFQMWITLSRPFDPHTDKLHLELKTGPHPAVSNKTHIIVPLVEDLEDGRWEAAVVERDDKRLKLSVNSPPTAIIGRYQLTVETSCANGKATSRHDPANDIYMLFNPWCEDDSVFLDSEKERQEFVLNDVGRIYYGTQLQIGERTWDYGQFNDGILAACLFMLDRSQTQNSGWGDPINVARIISAMVNAPDDFGVLEGNWSGDYSRGTSPTVWSGSVEILKKYYESRGTPVKFGQCWVFAGVFTTVLRCLGIPARTVTNFSSAHDTDVSLTTDIYLDEEMEPIEHLNADSIWNFHVWTDCWMSRPDLPPGYGGWQTVDATPQETSQGIFRCGPASLSAIRNGEVYLKHDCAFVFAEVNSDKIYWQKNKDGTFSQIYSEKNTVGLSISTKAVGSDERQDITHLYKHPEGKTKKTMTQPHERTQAASKAVRAYDQFILNLLKMFECFTLFNRLRGGTYCRGNRLQLRLQSSRLLVSDSGRRLFRSDHGGRRSQDGGGCRADHQAEERQLGAAHRHVAQPVSRHVLHRGPQGHCEKRQSRRADSAQRGERFDLGVEVRHIQEPADRSGCPDAHTYRQGYGNTASPGEAVQLPTQDPRPRYKAGWEGCGGAEDESGGFFHKPSTPGAESSGISPGRNRPPTWEKDSPWRYRRTCLRLLRGALRPHPSRTEEITGLSGLQAAHPGPRRERHRRRRQKQRGSVRDLSSSDSQSPAVLRADFYREPANSFLPFYLCTKPVFRSCDVFRRRPD